MLVYKYAFICVWAPGWEVVSCVTSWGGQLSRQNVVVCALVLWVGRGAIIFAFRFNRAHPTLV